MPKFLKVLLPLVLLGGCSKSDEEALPQANENTNSQDAGNCSDPSQELGTDEARAMLPKAASLSRQEFSEILLSPPLTVKEIKNQSLTALLLAVDPLHAQAQNPNVIGDFFYLATNGEGPDPGMILAAIEGQGDGDYVSVIQPEYITNCTCENRGDTAKGHVEYRAGDVYVGSADFTAQRQGDHWQIVAFRLPEYRLATNLQANGTWQLTSEQELLGIAYP